MKTWYKVSTKGGGWAKYNSIEELIKYKQERPFFPVLKITKVTEELLDQQVVDDVNSQVDYKTVR